MRSKQISTLSIALVLVAIVAVSGCTQRILDFTVVSSKNTGMDIPASAKGPRVEGVDSVPIILVPLGTPNLKEAIDRAIESAGPEYDALIDGVLYYTYVYFIFGVAKYKVEGTPINSNMVNQAALDTTGDQLADMGPILFHSRTGKHNEKAIDKIGVARR